MNAWWDISINVVGTNFVVNNEKDIIKHSNRQTVKLTIGYVLLFISAVYMWQAVGHNKGLPDHRHS